VPGLRPSASCVTATEGQCSLTQSRPEGSAVRRSGPDRRHAPTQQGRGRVMPIVLPDEIFHHRSKSRAVLLSEAVPRALT
jgi:hypothetical protein